jgi:crossover junction endodeoxyribonuclease RuvC
VILLGVDPGSVRLGYGVVRLDGEALTYIAAGVISAPAGWNKYRRIGELGRELEAVFAEHAIDEMAIEAGFVNGQQGALTSGAARGVAGYIAARRGLTVVEYAPATVKQAVTGHGAAEKAAVARSVRLLLRLQRTPEPDTADALAVAITHARRREVA